MNSHEKGIKMKTWRRLTELLQAFLILGLPFLRIGGESAIRFDLPTLRLYFFGSAIWMQEFFIVLVACILILLLIVLITIVFGRVWCGWFCPQTVLVDFIPFVDRVAKRGLIYAAFAYVVTLLTSILVAASLIWYFVSPYEFIPALLDGRLGTVVWGFWIALTAILFLNFAFLRHKFCATICPYAKLQSVMFDKSTLIIELDPKRSAECINCSSCVRICPTGIDIRKGLDAACINCAECVDACTKVMGRFGKKGLIHYAFGTGGEGKVVRQNSLVVGGFALLFLVATLYLSFGRTGIDFTILPHAMEPRVTRDGRVMNAYVLAVKNMRSVPVTLEVSVEKFDDTVVQSLRDPLSLAGGTYDRFPLFINTTNPLKLRGSKRIRITLRDRGKDIQLTNETNFVFPEEK